MVVGSRAVIAAADILGDGEDTCTVWATFARRGYGFSATQGSADDRNDSTEAFWQTLEKWAGTCREVVVTRNDGRQHRAFFRFL
jgi:hypothetical protein